MPVVLSILSRLKSVKFLLPIIVIGFLLKSVNSSPHESDSDAEVTVEKLPFCDENLINDRQHSKR